VVLEAVKQYGLALQDAHADLTKDKEVVLEAVKQDGWALRCAHADLTKDKEVVLEAVKQYGLALRFAHEDLKKDKEVVLEAVKQYGRALCFAHADLTKDKEVVLEAVKKKGTALRFAHEDLKPFLKAFLALKASSNNTQEQNKKAAVDAILNQCEKLFIANQESTANLIKVLEKTSEFINNPKKEVVAKEYQWFANAIAKKPSQGMQLLGKLMMGLALIILGASIFMASTGVGLLPAAGALASGLGIFAGGAVLNEQGKKDNTALIQSMNDLTQTSPKQ